MKEIQAQNPQSALQPYVDCYYFIKSNDPAFKSVHYSFPHTHTALSIYRNAGFSFAENYSGITESDVQGSAIIIQKRTQAPLLVDISGRIDRVTILFKDFGLNHFMDTPVSEIMEQKDRLFNLWPNDIDCQNLLKRMWDTEDMRLRVKHLETFLLKKLRPVNYMGVEEAIPMLHDFETRNSIENIAKKLNMSIRTFNRNFKKMIGTSPVEYRRIAQFRHSLNNKLFHAQFKRLTEIGYESNFYDQSYFNKLYRKLTGANPRAFFNSIAHLGNDKLIFRYVKR